MDPFVVFYSPILIISAIVLLLGLFVEISYWIYIIIVALLTIPLLFILLVCRIPNNVQPSSPEETNSHEYSDNDVLAYAMNDIQCKRYILEACSSYPRYGISFYHVVYGICNVKKISLSKYEVTLNGHVVEPDIYAIGYNERHAFSKKYTFEVLDGRLRLSPSYAIEKALVDANRGKYNF